MEPKKYVVIENGVVTNIVLATPEYAAEQGWIEYPEDTLDIPAIGMLYQDGDFLPPPRNIEAEWVAIRSQRDQLILESDSLVSTPDRWALLSTEKQQEWLDYRQALRDLPQTFEDPAEVICPTKPE